MINFITTIFCTDKRNENYTLNGKEKLIKKYFISMTRMA